MERASACMHCGEKGHLSRQCKDLKVPPEGFFTGGGGGGGGHSHDDDDESLGLRGSDSLGRSVCPGPYQPTHRVMNFYPHRQSRFRRL